MATTTKQRIRLGDLLVARGIVTEEQLAEALEVQRHGQQEKLLGEILVDSGFTDPEQVLSAVAEMSGVPFARLTPRLLDPEVRNTVPETFCRKHSVLPLFRVRDVLTVAVAEPANAFLVDETAQVAGVNVQTVAATMDNIYQMLEQTCAEDKVGPPAAPSERTADSPISADFQHAEDYESAYGNWPPEKVAGLLVQEAVAARASAIHLEPDQKVLRIRFRIDGVLHVVMRPPARLAAGLAAAFNDMMGFPAKGHPGAGWSRSTPLMIQGRPVQLHLASVDAAFGPRTIVRLVRDDEAERPLEQLGCDFNLLARCRELMSAPRGLVLVAGPRAAGTTTTLYSMLRDLDPVRLNVCTFEAYIGFHLPGVTQVSPATCGISDAASAVSRLLLQEPDVLALDDCLDERVAALAVEAARDDCLVFARVRALDAAGAVAALAGAVPPGALASVLRGVMAQRLVRTVCPHCRVAYDPPALLRRPLTETFGSLEGLTKGRGCPACRRTGFLGRIGLFELVPADGDLPELTRAGAEPDALRAAARDAGYPSLWTDGVNKAKAGITSLEEVVDVLQNCPGRPPSLESLPQRLRS
ncbi:MAG: ATPase, T2SS/T4P/T4SS family [Phycisphaerae bacterium]